MGKYVDNPRRPIPSGPWQPWRPARHPKDIRRTVVKGLAANSRVNGAPAPSASKPLVLPSPKDSDP